MWSWGRFRKPWKERNGISHEEAYLTIFSELNGQPRKTAEDCFIVSDRMRTALPFTHVIRNFFMQVSPVPESLAVPTYSMLQKKFAKERKRNRAQAWISRCI